MAKKSAKTDTQSNIEQIHRKSITDEEYIVERIFEAVIEQRLPPGTKLSESALSEAFGVGRMRVRRSLLLLASRQIVDLQSNRGAYISTPSESQARDVFEARQAIEPSVTRKAVARASTADISNLKNHLNLESKATAAGERQRAIRLSGEFHVMLAKISKNEVMERMVKELVTRTSLIIGMFGESGTGNCHDNEHELVLDAFINKDEDKAAKLMKMHLQHIEGQIDLSVKNPPVIDLVRLFQDR